MNQYLKPPLETLLDAGRFDPYCAESSWSLPAAWYFDAQIYQLEQRHIFRKSWCYQCHQSVLANPGDAWQGEVADLPVIIRRLPDRGLQAFTQTDSAPLAVEVFAGFVFVNLDTDARPLSELCGNFIDDVRRCCPRIDELRPQRRIERSVAANWKTLIDNNHECYHCAGNHKSLMKLIDYRHQAVWSDDGITLSHKVKHKQLDNPAYRVDPQHMEQEALFGFIWRR